MKLRWLAVALPLVACGPQPLKDTGTPISELAKKKPVGEAAPIAPAPPPKPVLAPEAAETAMQNYRRIAELATDPETKAEAERRLADLQIQLKEQQLANTETDAAQRESVQLYDRLLTSKAGSDPEAARLLYQRARAQQNIGEFAASAESLRQLIERFPNSEYTGEAHFRRAEMLYRAEDFANAELEYRAVLGDAASRVYHEPSQHKLGWSLYKQARYDEALSISFDILERELPAGEQSDPAVALKGIAPGKRELTQDALRVASLSLTNLGAGPALSAALAKRGNPRYTTLMYNALGAELLDKKRFTDAAKTYLAYAEANERSALAPQYQSRAIEALRDGNFTDQVVAAKVRYVADYDPKSSYWSGRSPNPEVLSQLRLHLDDLARYHHTRARAAKAANPIEGREDFVAAAERYRRYVELFPKDPKSAEISVLLADALLDAGQTEQAASAYDAAATLAPQSGKADDAAYAAVLAYQKIAEQTPSESAMQRATDSGVKFADSFPAHPQALTVLTRASEDLYRLKDVDRAITLAARVVKSPANEDLKRTAWGVVADAQLAQKRYPEAEAATLEVLRLMSVSDPQRGKLEEQLAAAIYKQGEAARAAGKQADAAAAFQRVAQRVPNASIRSTADYDAATALITAEQWANAGRLLEDFRQRYPGNALLPDVDKKLAVVYQKTSQPTRTAEVMARIAGRSGESAEVRREAAWTQVSLLDQTGSPAAYGAYENYLRDFGGPFERGIEARHRLSEMAKSRGDNKTRERWLRELMAADANGGRERNDRSKFLAAQATLEFAREDALAAQAIKLKLPLDKSVVKKKQAMEKAIAALSKASDFGYAEVTTAATYELGALYANFSKELLNSERPKKLSALEKEQYSLLLEEQAFPFEEKAIQWHESNLKRIGQGNFDRWVTKSADALAEIAPGKYGKKEKTGGAYDSLR